MSKDKINKNSTLEIEAKNNECLTKMLDVLHQQAQDRLIEIMNHINKKRSEFEAIDPGK